MKDRSRWQAGDFARCVAHVLTVGLPDSSLSKHSDMCYKGADWDEVVGGKLSA